MIKFKFFKNSFIFTIFLYVVFPGWVLYFGTNLKIGYPRILMLCLFVLLLLSKMDTLINDIKQLLKYKAIRFAILFTLWELLALVLIFFTRGIFHISNLMNIFMRICGSLLVLYCSFYITKETKISDIIKFLYIIIYSIIIIGLIDFFAYFFNIVSIENILEALINIRPVSKVFLGNIPRIQGCFDEPAYYAYFITLLLPLIYYYTNSKIKLLKNNYLNLISKKTLPILAWLTLIGTQSPIFLIFAIIETYAYLLIKQKLSLKTILFYFFGSLLLVVVFIILFLHIDLSGTFLGRIQIVLKNITNYKTLIFVEGSLATRLCSYLNMLYIFFKYPLLGCGTGELQNALIYQFLHSPIILTPEIASKILSDYPGINPSVFFGILAEQGFIGLILYFLIIFFTIKKSINISKYLSHQIANFIIGLVHVMCIFIILSFYDSYVYTPILWLIIGIIYGFANKYNRTTMKGKPNENINS